MSRNTHPRARSRPLRRTLIVVGCAVVLCSAIPPAASAQGTPASEVVQSAAGTPVGLPAVAHGAVGVMAQVRSAGEIWIGPTLAHTLAESPAMGETGDPAARLEEGSVLATAETLGRTRQVTIAYLGT